MLKNDLRVERSIASIEKSLTYLIGQKPFSEITIKEIAALSMLNRKTIYAHYETKEDIYAQMMFRLFEEIFSPLLHEKILLGPDEPSPSLLTDSIAFFQAIEKNRTNLEILITAETSGLAFHAAEKVVISHAEDLHLKRETTKGQIPFSLEIERIKDFLIMMIDWYLDQEEPSVEDSAHVLCKVLGKSMSSTLRYRRSPVK